MRRVIYLIEQPFDDRNYQRFGIQAWLQRDWALEVWDLTPWAHPDVWHDFLGHGKSIRRFAGYFAVSSGRELANRIAECGRINYFIDLTGDNYQTTRAKRLLMRMGAVRVACAIGSIPVPDGDLRANPLARLAKVLGRGPRGAFKWLSNAFFSKVVARKLTSGWTIVGGERSIDMARHARRLILAHNFDYDIYLDLLKSARAGPERYAVFIDQDYCFHPEYDYQDAIPVITPEKYFPAVCKGLAAISAGLKLEMRIAAHPRSTYRERGMDYFGALPLEYGRTGELIRGCSLVVCHDSTAIQFAVLFGKPVIFLTTDQLTRAPEGPSICQAAAELGKLPINLDRCDLGAIDWQDEVRVDAEKYQRYIGKYIKARGSREKPVWEIVIDEIETAESATSC